MACEFNTGKRCEEHCKYHYRCDDCLADCTAGEPAAPCNHDVKGVHRCWSCWRRHEISQGRLYDAAGKMRDSILVFLRTHGDGPGGIGCACAACGLGREALSGVDIPPTVILMKR